MTDFVVVQFFADNHSYVKENLFDSQELLWLVIISFIFVTLVEDLRSRRV